LKKEVKKRNIWSIVLVIVVGVLLLMILSVFASLFGSNGFLGNVAVIPVNGVITVHGQSSLLGGEEATSEKLVKFIEEADENSMVEAIVFDINSPGGSAVASDEIASAIKRAEKPTVAIVREVGASGGYWIASSADHIIVNRMSIVGSIGVISSYLEFARLLENYNITYQRLVAGKYKDMGTPLKELDEEERVLIQGKIDKIHSFFIDEIAANRGLEREKVLELATGEIFLGVEALELGLVDELGDQKAVERYLKDEIGLEDIDYIYYRSTPSLWDAFGGIISPFFYYIGMGMGETVFNLNRNLGIQV
jgi:protease-4